MRTVLSFEQFLLESAGDDSRRNALVHSILLRNRDRIKDEANVDDYLYDRIVDELSENPPLSADEEDVVTDAIQLAYQWRNDAIPYMKMDQGDRMSQSSDGKTGVAIQNYDNAGSGDSQAY